MKYLALSSLLLTFFSFSCMSQNNNSKAKTHQFAVVKTDEEWHKILTPEQFSVTRRKSTERACSGAYWNSHEEGVYQCVCCRQDLFDSKTKFESGTGWPSFYKALKKENIIEEADNTLGMERVEILCSRCGAHLGHVFEDGPRPTGLRYCLNSLALHLEKAKK